MASVLEAGFRNNLNPTANSINMGDTIQVHFTHGGGGSHLEGVIQHFDFDTNALMLVTTSTANPPVVTLTVVKDYFYITKVVV
tara:strand:- start:232 stop:480 length:249 start_codon:yes stop_codon:yes gene_type:complete